MADCNFALLCADKRDEDALCRLSQDLTAIAPSKYILGKNSLPHVSVLQFQTEKDAASLWQTAQRLQARPVHVRAARYYWHPPAAENGYVYTGIETDRPESLLELHRDLLSLFPSLTPHNRAGKDYFPHFTLGYSRLSAQTPLPAAMDGRKDVWGKDIPLKLALGASGPEWQFERVLFE